nr:hypothetical protein [Aeromonas veronii]
MDAGCAVWRIPLVRSGSHGATGFVALTFSVSGRRAILGTTEGLTSGVGIFPDSGFFPRRLQVILGGWVILRNPHFHPERLQERASSRVSERSSVDAIGTAEVEDWGCAGFPDSGFSAYCLRTSLTVDSPILNSLAIA